MLLRNSARSRYYAITIYPPSLLIRSIPPGSSRTFEREKSCGCCRFPFIDVPSKSPFSPSVFLERDIGKVVVVVVVVVASRFTSKFIHRKRKRIRFGPKRPPLSLDAATCRNFIRFYIWPAIRKCPMIFHVFIRGRFCLEVLAGLAPPRNVTWPRLICEISSPGPLETRSLVNSIHPPPPPNNPRENSPTKMASSSSSFFHSTEIETLSTPRPFSRAFFSYDEQRTFARVKNTDFSSELVIGNFRNRKL